MFNIRSIAAVGAIAVGCVGAFVASPARAEASCYAESCEGLDPFATICVNDAYIATLAYFRNSAGSGRVEMWYSERCRSNWAATRVYEGPSGDMWAGIWKDGQGTISGVYDLFRGPGAPQYRYPFVYTGMIDGSVRTCAGGVNVNDGHHSGAEPRCA